MIDNSMFFYTFLTLLFYMAGVFLQKKFKKAWLNPLLISIVFMIIIVLVFKIDYAKYKESTSLLSYFLTPATVCLAVPLYEKLEELKNQEYLIKPEYTEEELEEFNNDDEEHWYDEDIDYDDYDDYYDDEE